jgi:PadR family transcriptional regulator PadR
VLIVKFPVSSTLLDACVLGILSSEPAYGYYLTHKIKDTIEVSESTLYPVLRRLLKDGFLYSYDEPFDGRNRKYYKITEKGTDMLETYVCEWQLYKENIEQLLIGGLKNEQI